MQTPKVSSPGLLGGWSVSRALFTPLCRTAPLRIFFTLCLVSHKGATNAQAGMVASVPVRLTAAVDQKYRRAVAEDICTLINHYLSKVSGGLPEAFTTLRQAWQDLNFSFVFTVHPSRLCTEAVQNAMKP